MPASNRDALDAWLDRSADLVGNTPARPEANPVDPELLAELLKRPWARQRIDQNTEVVIGRGAVLGQELVAVVTREIDSGRQIGAVVIPTGRLSSFRNHIGSLDRYLGAGRS